MAKKRSGGGGSNVTLIIFLVLFILVALGGWGYAYSVSQEVADKVKEAKDATDKVALLEKDRDWYRFQARLYRLYMGHPVPGVEPKDIARNKSEFDKGILASIPKDANRKQEVDDLKALLTDKLGPRMPFDGEKAQEPDTNFEKIIEAKEKAIRTQVNANKGLTTELATAKDDATKEKTNAKNEETKFRTALNDLTTKQDGDFKKLNESIDKFQNDLTKSNVDKNTALASAAGEKADKIKLEGQKSRLERDLIVKKNESAELRIMIDELKGRLGALAEKSGVDLKALDAEALDANARKILKTWKKDWRIVGMDQRGNMPYINLGSTDKLTAQQTFSIHSVSLNGELNPNAKGTVEVVRVIGPHLSRVRITSIKDAKADPILTGDRLFNPTWDPFQKKHIALAGLVDLTGEGTDNTAEFIRMLKRQNVIVDAYIDVKDPKGPTLVGKVNEKTDYVLLAGDPDEVKHPRAKEISKAFAGLVKKMRDEAKDNGVAVIGLGKYLDMTGYRSPKVVTKSSLYKR